MKKLSAFGSQPSARAARRKLWTVLAVFAVLLLTLGAGDTYAARFSDLGHRMMCTCGCNQVLLECNHVGCTVSDTMRAELRTALDAGKNDREVLDTFVQKYGATVLNAPGTEGFDLVAWIMPFAVLAAATWFVVLFVRRWQARPVRVTTPVSELKNVNVEALRNQAREETQI